MKKNCSSCGHRTNNMLSDWFGDWCRECFPKPPSKASCYFPRNLSHGDFSHGSLTLWCSRDCLGIKDEKEL